MANCKDCLCVDVCKMRSDIVSADYYPEILKKKFEEECNCPHFKDRTRFVELPCKIGATVYVKMQFGGYAEGKVRDYSYFISCGFCVVVTSEKFDKQHIPFSEFGKTIFLTSKEAELSG